MTARSSSGAKELNIDVDRVREIVAVGRMAMFEMPDPEMGDIVSETEIDAATTVETTDPTLLSDEKERDNTAEEVAGMIDGLNVDEQAEILALVYIGQGEYEPEDLENAVRDAKVRANGPASRILLDMELFPSYLEQGLDSWETWRAKQAD